MVDDSYNEKIEKMSQELLSISEASEWASDYLDIYERRNNYNDKTNF